MASYSILLTRSAAKELERVPTKDRRRIVTKIGTLANNPRPVGAEKLSRDDKYRIRQGDYRILFKIVDAELIVTSCASAIAVRSTGGRRRTVESR